jgi:hypothetical protein
MAFMGRRLTHAGLCLCVLAGLAQPELNDISARPSAETINTPVRQDTSIQTKEPSEIQQSELKITPDVLKSAMESIAWAFVEPNPIKDQLN